MYSTCLLGKDGVEEFSTVSNFPEDQLVITFAGNCCSLSVRKVSSKRCATCNDDKSVLEYRFFFFFLCNATNNT